MQYVKFCQENLLVFVFLFVFIATDHRSSKSKTNFEFFSFLTTWILILIDLLKQTREEDGSNLRSAGIYSYANQNSNSLWRCQLIWEFTSGSSFVFSILEKFIFLEIEIEIESISNLVKKITEISKEDGIEK